MADQEWRYVISRCPSERPPFASPIQQFAWSQAMGGVSSAEPGTLPPAENRASAIEFSNGQSAGAYLLIGDFLQVTIWQEKVDPEQGAEYVWDVVQSADPNELPKFVVVAAPGVSVTTGIGAEMPLDISEDPGAKALVLFMLHPLDVSQKESGTVVHGERMDPRLLNPQADIIRLQDRALLPRFDEKIRPDQQLASWYTGGGMFVQPRSDGVSIFSQFASTDREKPIEFRISVPPGSATDTFAYKVFPHKVFRSGLPDRDVIAVVSTAGVKCEVVQSSDMGVDLFGAYEAKALNAIDERPDPGTIVYPARGATYRDSRGKQVKFAVIEDGPKAIDVFWPVIKLGTDLGIGMVPVFGDLADLADFGKALVTGSDKWGDEVGTFELALMGLGVLIPVVGSGVVRRAGRGLATGAGGAAEAIISQSSSMRSSLYNLLERQLEQQGRTIIDFIESSGAEAYLGTLLELKVGDIRLVNAASERVHAALKTAHYVDNLEAKLPPKGRAPDVDLPASPNSYLRFFRKLTSSAKRVFPPAGSLDDLVSETGVGFKVPYLQSRYADHVANARGTPYTPKEWLRALGEADAAKVYVKDWMGEAAYKVEFGSGLKGQAALDDYFEAILDEASEGRTQLGRAFDYDRFPIDSGSGVTGWPEWKPGYPIDMPINGGFRPLYGEAAERGRRNLAFFEFRTRLDSIGEVVLSDGAKLTPDMLKGADIDTVIKWAGDAEVEAAMKKLRDQEGVYVGQPFWRGEIPFAELKKGLNGKAMEPVASGGRIEFEHFKPQRTHNWLKHMASPDDYHKLDELAGWTNPNNLMPMPHLRHMEVDAMAAKMASEQRLSNVYLYQGGKKSLQSFTDDERVVRPFSGWTNSALNEVTSMLRSKGRVPWVESEKKRATEILEFLRVEVRHRQMDVPVPVISDLLPAIK